MKCLRRIHPKPMNGRAQTVVEYLVVLGLVVVVGLAAFRSLLPKKQQDTVLFFDESVKNIYGDAPAVFTIGVFNQYP